MQETAPYILYNIFIQQQQQKYLAISKASSNLIAGEGDTQRQRERERDSKRESVRQRVKQIESKKTEQ